MKQYLKPQLTEQELNDLAFEQARIHVGTDIKLQHDRKLFAFAFIIGFKNREDEIEQIRKQIQYDNLQETLIEQLKEQIKELEVKACKCEPTSLTEVKTDSETSNIELPVDTTTQENNKEEETKPKKTTKKVKNEKAS